MCVYIYIYIFVYKKSNTTLGPKFFCRSRSAVTRRAEVVQLNPPENPNLSTRRVDLAMPQGCRNNFASPKSLKYSLFRKHLSPKADVEKELIYISAHPACRVQGVRDFIASQYKEISRSTPQKLTKHIANS